MLTREGRSLELRGQRWALLTQEDRRRRDEYVRHARAAGASWQAIGDALGITRQSAWERFRHLPGCAVKGTATSRLPRPPAQRSVMKYKLKDETGKYVLQMRAKGASWQAIGDALGITRQSAWERFRHLPGCAAKGTAISKPTDLPDARKSALRMWAEGASWQAIGDALGITRQSAWERFRPLCVYRKGQGIPGSVLQARYQQPHDFAGWAIESAKTDKIIQQWLETPDSELGRMAKFGHAVPPIRLLGRDVLRNFLMAAGHDDIAPGSVPESANCPVCGRSFRNEHFLASHRKRDHGKTTAKHKPIN